MPRMPILYDQFERQILFGNLPQFPIINMYAEEAPTEQGGVALQSRLGIYDRSKSMGAGPVKKLFQANGVLSSALFGISGTHLYSELAGVTTDRGSIASAGTGPFSIAGYEDRIFIAGGGAPMMWDGASLTTLAFPDTANVTKVVTGSSRAIFIRADTGKFYWSGVLSTTVDALSFATAENQPDDLLDMLFIDDTLVLFGRETVEFWPNTGDANLPFQPLEGRVFERGIWGTGCATQVGSSFAWINNIGQICLGEPDNLISRPWVEEKIFNSNATYGASSISLWRFVQEGVEFLALRTYDGTYAYSTRSKTWSEFKSDSQTNWIPSTYANGVFGSSLDGKTLEFQHGFQDLGGTLERRFRSGLELDSGGIVVNNITLRTSPGVTLAFPAPTIDMRRSLDGGSTWGSWRTINYGNNPDYRHKVQWLGCGMIGQPGGMFEFRNTSPVTFRVSGVYYNEPYGGI